MTENAPQANPAVAATQPWEATIAMPGKSQMNGKPYSVLTDDERTKAFADFQQKWQEANKPAPDSDYYKNTADWRAACHSYDKNPISKKVQAIREECNLIINGDGKAVSSDLKAERLAKADQNFKDQSNLLAQEYMTALDLGAKNPEVEAQRKGAFQQLISGDFIGALQSFAMTMPPVVAFFRSITSGFTGQKISYDQARQEMRLEEAYGGVAAVLGVDKDQTITSAKNNFAASVPAPAAGTTTTTGAVQYNFTIPANLAPTTPIAVAEAGANGSTVPAQPVPATASSTQAAAPAH